PISRPRPRPATHRRRSPRALAPVREADLHLGVPRPTRPRRPRPQGPQALPQRRHRRAQEGSRGMNDNHVTRRVYSRTDGRGVPKPKAPRICTWDGCDQPAFHFIPVCYDHGQTISEVFAPPSGDGVQATLLAEAEFNKRLLERERQRREVRELRASRGNQPGWIYYVHTDGKVKIGYSTDITRRLRAYPPGSEVLAVHPGTL